MLNQIKKGQLFINQVIARLKGDNAEVLANKIARKGLSAVEGQLASLNSKRVDLESAVEDAEEALIAAKFPIELISSNEMYIKEILSAQNKLNNAKAELQATEEAIVYFTDLLNSY